MAAQLLLGPRAFISHRAAARYWGLDRVDADLVEFTLAGAKRAAPHGVHLHYSASLQRQDVRFLTPFRLTKVERTLIDLGAVVAPHVVEEGLESALFHRLTRLDRVSRRLHTCDGRASEGSAFWQRY